MAEPAARLRCPTTTGTGIAAGWEQERRLLARLRFVYRRTGPSLLVADGARINPRGLAAVSRAK